MALAHLPHETVEIVDSVFFSQLVVNFEVRWKRASNISNFSDFPPNMSIVVVTDFGNFENWLIML